MKRSAQYKDLFREIKNNLGRFLSIFLIVVLGVAFFSGIRSAEPDMRLTADNYFDKRELYDGRIVSTLGLTDDDLEAIRSLSLIEEAYPEHSADFLCNIDDRDKVLHVLGITDNINTIEVEHGRLPEKDDECVVDAELYAKDGFVADRLSIGDKITLKSGTDDSITDTLKYETYTITGFVSSPLYFSFSRGSTAIGTGSVYSFVYVNDGAFVTDYYTAINYRVKGASELNCYSDEYEKLILDAMDQIEGIEEDRCNARYDEIYQDAADQISDAEKEISDGRRELSDAEKELEDGKKKIEDGKRQLAAAEGALADNKAYAASGLADALNELNDARTVLDHSRKELDDGWAAYNKGLSEYETGLSEYNENLRLYETNAAQLEKLKEQLVKANEAIPILEQAVKDARAAQEQGVEGADELLAQLMVQLDETRNTVAFLADNVAVLEAALEGVPEQLALAKNQLDEGKTQLDNTLKTIQDGEAQYAEGLKQYEDGLKEYKASIAAVDEGFKNAEQQIAAGRNEIERNEAGIPDAEKEIADGKNKLSDAEKELDEAKEELDKIDHPTWYSFERMDDADYSEYEDNAERMKRIGKVFPVIFFLVAALISLTTMTRMVEEQRMQIGTMKALGYDRVSIIKKYLLYAGIATVFGSIIGMIIGEQTLPRVILSAYSIMYHYIREFLIPFNWNYGLLSAGTAVFCVLFTTVYSCYRELRAVPAELMRPPAPKNGRRVFLEKIGFIWNSLNFSWKATVRNLNRYKKRLFMTVFGIGGSMALILAGFGLQDSIMEVVTLQYEELQQYDMDVYLSDTITEGQRAEVMDSIANMVGADHMTEALMKKIKISGEEDTKECYLMVPENNEIISDFIVFRDRMSHESYEIGDDGVIITEKIANMTGIRVGDTVKIEEDDRICEAKVSAICENYMSHYLYMSSGLYKKLFEEDPVYNDVMISTANLMPVDVSEENRISINEETGAEIVSHEGVLSINYLISLKSRLNDMLSTLDIVIVVLIISAGLLSFVVLYNLNNINITERRRELATIKVLGFNDMEVALYVYRENIILTIIGIVVGIVLGVILHRFLITTVEIDSFMFGRHALWYSYLYSILITGAFAVIVNWVMFYKLRKIDMVESLKSVE